MFLKNDMLIQEKMYKSFEDFIFQKQRRHYCSDVIIVLVM